MPIEQDASTSISERDLFYLKLPFLVLNVSSLLFPVVVLIPMFVFKATFSALAPFILCFTFTAWCFAVVFAILTAERNQILKKYKSILVLITLPLFFFIVFFFVVSPIKSRYNYLDFAGPIFFLSFLGLFIIKRKYEQRVENVKWHWSKPLKTFGLVLAVPVIAYSWLMLCLMAIWDG